MKYIWLFKHCVFTQELKQLIGGKRGNDIIIFVKFPPKFYLICHSSFKGIDLCTNS